MSELLFIVAYFWQLPWIPTDVLFISYSFDVSVNDMFYDNIGQGVPVLVFITRLLNLLTSCGSVFTATLLWYLGASGDNIPAPTCASLAHSSSVHSNYACRSNSAGLRIVQSASVSSWHYTLAQWRFSRHRHKSSRQISHHTSILRRPQSQGWTNWTFYIVIETFLSGLCIYYSKFHQWISTTHDWTVYGPDVIKGRLLVAGRHQWASKN